MEVNRAAKGEPPKFEIAELQGTLKAPKGSKYGKAKVDAALWAAWVAANNTLRYCVEGSVFVLDKDGKTKLHALTLKVIK